MQGDSAFEYICRSESVGYVSWISDVEWFSSTNGEEPIISDAPFFSIILLCDEDINLVRLQAEGRGGTANTKLTDPDMLLHIRQREKIHRFGGAKELELDISDKTPDEAAEEIAEFIG